MKRIKYLFAGLILLLALPAWRLLDWAIVTIPIKTLITAQQTLWSALFIFFPLTLIFTKFNKWMLLLGTLCFAVLSWWSTPSTNQAAMHPELTHCGRMSYTGFFYPIRGILSEVHQDDLEIRNQMCWLVKLIKRVPDTIAAEDLAHHLNIMKDRLMKPAMKYRASLPWITVLLGKYLTSSQIENSPVLIQNLGFWSNLYSEEVSGRVYGWYEWPHSQVVKFEYGLIEDNWEKIRLEVGN